MKFKKISIALVVFMMVGLAIFTQLLIRQEKKAGLENIQRKGNDIVSLIALHSIKDFKGDRRDFFLKTVIENTSYQNLAYCFINDDNGKPVVSLSPAHLENQIPQEVSTSALASMGMIHQTFKTDKSGERIYEFAKPIFEKGEKTGTVRIGLKYISPSIISMERISLLAMLSFFIISAVTIVYYGFIKALIPLRQFSTNGLQTIHGLATAANPPSAGFSIGSVIEDSQKSLIQFQARLKDIETNNEELASRMGVLRFKKNQVVNILNSINFGIIITDLQGNISHINDYVLNLLNKVRDDVINRPLDGIFENPEILSFVSQHDGYQQRRPDSHMDTSFPELAPGETYRISCVHLMDNGKELMGKIFMFNNVTTEKEAEKATQNFTAHVSHELMTPLTTIQSLSEMLMDGEIQEMETQKEFYNTINSETTRLSRLIKDLLNLTKIDMGSLTLERALVKSDWLFEDCISAIHGAARAKNISIHRHLPDNFPSLMGDKDLLQGALINILGNAVKYTPENGNIHFELKEQNSKVIFDIKDTGYGMSEEDLTHIFDKFYRSKNPQIAEQQGTGLGLAITYQIIDLHGGDVKVTSEIGRGTHFMVKIPKEEFYLEKQ
jgi:signal transduction histidine kinase